MERLMDTGASPADLMTADRSFHDLLAHASDNRVLAAVSRDIRQVTGTLWRFSGLDPTDTDQVAEQHRRIADAILARDGRAAASAMREHLVWAARADLDGLGETAELRLPTATMTE
jgi:DNA-binding FadR family transcriptional regulator